MEEDIPNNSTAKSAFNLWQDLNMNRDNEQIQRWILPDTLERVRYYSEKRRCDKCDSIFHSKKSKRQHMQKVHSI
jgi:hypothetical protein